MFVFVFVLVFLVVVVFVLVCVFVFALQRCDPSVRGCGEVDYGLCAIKSLTLSMFVFLFLSLYLCLCSCFSLRYKGVILVYEGVARWTMASSHLPVGSRSKASQS